MASVVLFHVSLVLCALTLPEATALTGTPPPTITGPPPTATVEPTTILINTIEPPQTTTTLAPTTNNTEPQITISTTVLPPLTIPTTTRELTATTSAGTTISAAPRTTTTSLNTTTTTASATTTSSKATTTTPKTTTTSPKTTTITPKSTNTSPLTTTTIPRLTTTSPKITTTTPVTTFTSPKTTTVEPATTTTVARTTTTTTTVSQTRVRQQPISATRRPTTTATITTQAPVTTTTAAAPTTTTVARTTSSVVSANTMSARLSTIRIAATNTAVARTTATTTTVTRTTVRQQPISGMPPIVNSWDPQYGPLVGLTKIVFRGTSLNNTIAGIYFAHNNNSAVIQDSAYDKLTVFSPSSNVTGFVSMTVIAIRNSSIVANLSFLYKPNPLILGFDFPPHLLTTGGSILTVIGKNLDSVATPQINVTVVIVKPGTDVKSNSYYQNCSFNETTESMTCLLPDLQLGDAFTRKLQQDQDDGISTSTTQPGSVAKLNGPNKTEAFVYLGFILDGDRTYDNVSDPRTGLRPLYLGFIPPPSINGSTDVMTFDPKSDDVIVIKGKNLNAACSYGVQCEVFIGQEPCTVLLITDNEITCRPKKDRPQSDQNDTFCTPVHPDSHTIKILIGLYTYYYGCLEYLTIDIPLIVGLTVGIGVPLLILLIFIAICLCRRWKRRRKDCGGGEDRRHLPTAEQRELQVNPIHATLPEVERGFDPSFPNNNLNNLGPRLDASEHRSRRSISSDMDDDSILVSGYDRMIAGQRESIYPPESSSFHADVEVGYDRSTSNSTDELVSVGVLQRMSIYPPARGDLGVPQEALRPASNRSSVFSPLRNNGVDEKLSQSMGSQSLKKVMKVEVPSRSEEPIADEGYLRPFPPSKSKSNHERHISHPDDFNFTQNRQSVFPPPSDPQTPP